MKIIIDPHPLERSEERGTNRSEIIEVIETGIASPAKNDRFSKSKVFPFNKERNGIFYEEKKVAVIYALQQNEIVTVTVYVFYGKWS